MLPTLEVLKLALEIIQERGWTYSFTSKPNGSVNLRTAVSRACSAICSDETFHATYGCAVAAIRAQTTEPVSFWEFGSASSKKPTRTQPQVEEMLAAVIAGLENHEKDRVTDGVRGASSGGGVDARTV